MWLYRDEELDSLVAVKALADNWSERADVRDRFLEEARILRRADSDYIVRVYDIGETADRIPYFVMTYADQGTVADLIESQRRTSLGETADLVTQAARGLTVLHGHGIVHRDVKPQNLLLRTDGPVRRRVLVADLGVAKALLHASGLTQVVGTPAYMAPEQVHMGVRLDQRADVHALGAVAYHLLTGQPARTGDFLSLMRPTMPAPPSQFAPVPATVDDVILRAVDPDRDERWPDVDSFARAFVAAAGGAPARVSRGPVNEPVTLVEARDGNQSAPEPVTPEAARSSGVPAVVWLLAVLVLIVGFVVGYQLFR